jgi:predicted transcriptional regulator
MSRDPSSQDDMTRAGPLPAPEEPLAPDAGFRAGGIMDFLPSSAAMTPVTEIIVRTPISVEPDMEIANLMRLFVEQGISGAPVVDGDGKPIGVVSKTDIVRELCEKADATRCVSDIMTPLAFVVGKESSIARAAAMMAYERVHRLIVVDRSGHILGLISAIDVLRWLARHDGYAVP